MLTQVERNIVERIRCSQEIEIHIPGVDDFALKVHGGTISHDIAIAVQNHLNRYNKWK